MPRLKVVVIGGSAASTPCMFDALARTTAPLAIVLLGRSGQRLDATVRASRLLLGDSPVMLSAVTMNTPDDLAPALRGAGLVVIQVRIGGMRGRINDELFPLKFGVPGDEGLGPGGLSAAWRTWPRLQELLGAVIRHAPGARIALLTSPIGILTRASLIQWPGVEMFGICELPRTTLLTVCHVLDAPAVEFDYVGLNHVGWFVRLRHGTRDILEEYAATRENLSYPSGQQIRQVGALPTKYVRLFDETAAVAHEQLSRAQPRASFLDQYARQAYATFASGTVSEVRAALALRPAPWYEHALFPLMTAIAGSPSIIPLFLTAPNGALLSCLRPDDPIEQTFDVHGGRLRRRGINAALPAAVIRALTAHVEYERLATDAILTRDRSRLVEALQIHPWSGVADHACALAEEIVQFAAYES